MGEWSRLGFEYQGAAIDEPGQDRIAESSRCRASYAAVAHAALTATPLTWNVIGLDSNTPTAGPEILPRRGPRLLVHGRPKRHGELGLGFG